MRNRKIVVVVALTLALVTASCSSPNDDEPNANSSTTTSSVDAGEGTDEEPIAVEDGIRIEVLSSQPDRATGPDARIRVSPEPGGEVDDLVVMLDDRDVTGALRVVDGALEGVVVGLVEGNNTIRANHAADPTQSALQRVRSWPLKGPMISGPQRPLLACSTVENGLGEPTDADCSAPTRVRWSYVNTAGTVADLADPAVLPPDLADVTVTTPAGEQTVPFVLRRETGVLNRSVYDIVAIDPSPDGPDDEHDDAAWNRRLIYQFGPGCASTHGQGMSLTALEDVDLLRGGYAIATATFNTGRVQCNDVVSAETTMMVKERFIELFGVPDHTIGVGTSGGAIQINLIAQNYPGLLDGGVGLETFPDYVTIASGVSDCQLLEHWFTSATGATLTPEQRTAVTGFASPDTCKRWSTELGDVVSPSAGCDPAIPVEQIYDATTNPGGVRCTYQDAAINVFGVDPMSGHARRPLDNLGVQYGLDALNEGVITFEQFLALNREIGGFDLDGRFQVLRHEADPEAVAVAYETGRVSSGTGDQGKIPIISIDIWNDLTGDVHDHARPFSLRERLTLGRSPAAAAGFQIWTREPAATDPTSATATTTAAYQDALAMVDRWLTSIDDDSSPGERNDVLDRNRPAGALDNCVIPGQSEPESGLHVYDEESPCSERYSVSGDPRIAAGAPRANDVIKCSLKSVDPDDYEAGITRRQYEQLLEVFPTGVCDWQQVGVGQVAPSMTDRSFEDVITPEQMA